MAAGTIRFWAAAKSAAGVGEEPYAAGTLAEALDAVRERHPGELTRVGARPDRDPHVGVVDHPFGERRDPFELFVGGLFEVGRDLPAADLKIAEMDLS